jgi:hypothetical protein
MSASMRTCGLAAAAAGLALASAAHAQPRATTLTVGKLSAEKTCTLYQESAGSSAVAVDAYGAVAVDSWRTWLVKDCVSNFATLRSSLEAALASSGHVALRPKGGAYTVSASLSQVGQDGGPPQGNPNGAYSVSTQGVFATAQVTVRDAAGRTVFGDVVTKHMETASDIRTSGLRSGSSQSGEAVYTELQNEIALTIARAVAFHIDPLRVVDGAGKQIRLNYGPPLLKLGAIVEVSRPGGASSLRYLVDSADGAGATAHQDSEGDSSGVGPGLTANFVESDDPAANRRRTQRVELPE